MRRIRGSTLLPIALVLGLPVFAAAAQSVYGKLFLLKDPQPGVDAAGRRIVVVGMEPVADGGTIVGDPRSAGATLQIVALGGAAQSQGQSFPLPASGWSRVPPYSSLPLVGYRYVDPSPGTHGPVRKALISRAAGRFTVSASITGANGPGPQPRIRLVPPDPGDGAGFVLSINGGDSYCVTFGGPAGGNVKNGPSVPPMN